MTTPENARGAAPGDREPRLGEEQSLIEQGARAIDNNRTFPRLSLPVDYALWLASLDLDVMPLGRFSNRPHPMLGTGWSFRSVGTTDPATIRAWWSHDPAANVGLPTTRGLLVIDADRHAADGVRSLEEWEDASGVDLSGAPRVVTPSGGVHLYFRRSVPCPSPVGWLDGVDVRADGAMVAAPPSARRRSFRGSADREPSEYIVEYMLTHGDLASIPEAPSALVEAVKRDGGRFRPGSVGAGSGHSPSGALLPTSELLERGFRAGERDDGFNRLAWRLLGQYWPHVELVRSIMYEVWQRTDQGGSPYPWSWADRKIARAVPHFEAERGGEVQ